MKLNYGNLIEKAKDGEFDVIIHGCNCFHTMGAGIAKYIKINFPEAYEADKKTGYADKNKVGTFSEVTIERNGNTFTVINAYTQYNFGNEKDQFEYDSFPTLLQEIKAKYGDKRIGLPLIGCGLAGGDEPRILKMIRENLVGVNYQLVEIDTKRKLNLGSDYVEENKSMDSAKNSSNLIVISPREKAPEGFTVINTTSRDDGDLGKQFSPFFLSNIELYEGQVAKNMENAWQFAKVYPEYADDNKNPTEMYFKWAKKGWNDSFAHRYPNGKGTIPLYSYWKTFNKDKQVWEEHKWDYITARKNIYFPLYAKAIVNTSAFQDLKQRLDNGEKIALWDFDGYDHAAKGMSYEDVINCEKYKCGHAFVLYGLLTGQLKVINNELIYDFKNEINMENTNNNQAVQADEEQFTFFFRKESPFSQWHPSHFKYKEYDFTSTEQFMMFSKAKTFGDHETAEKIINLEAHFDNPKSRVYDPVAADLLRNFKSGTVTREMILKNNTFKEKWHAIQTEIKKLGREVKNYDDAIWSEKRFNVVSVANREKFTQNEDLYKVLMATTGTTLVEASPYDKIWGIGLGEGDPNIKDRNKWKGLNLLGQVLTNLRVHLEQRNTNRPKP